MGKERITSKVFRHLTPEQQDEVRAAVRRGELEIVPTPDAQRFHPQGEKVMGSPEERRGSGLLRFLASLHPTTLRALIEEITTAAEERALEMIAKGNLSQLKTLQEMLDAIGKDPRLSTLIREQLERKGVNLEEVSPQQKLTLLYGALSQLTSAPRRVQIAERVADENARVAGSIEGIIRLADEVSFFLPQIPEATQRFVSAAVKLKKNNQAYGDFLHQLAIEKGIKNGARTAITVSGGVQFVAGMLGGGIAGMVSAPGYVGQEVGRIAERLPLPFAGGAMGLFVYGLLRILNGVDFPEGVFNLATLEQAAISFAVGAIALPMIFGIVKGAVRGAVGRRTRESQEE